jgi:signal transduction histidine kinase
LKSDFISNVTHEIKTPIATIRALAENVNEGWVKSSDKQRQYFRVIARESERLGHLVEKTLDFSRIESGRKTYRMEAVSVRDVINSSVERFRTLTDGQGVAITRDISSNLPTLHMDEVAIGQALLNLLDNAVKYSPAIKTISVKAWFEDGRVAIAVTDKGIGMDKAELSRIFEKFYRSESAPGKKVSGSGIGLTIVKDTVEAHGGHIEVLSKRKEGSTFTIVLPLGQKGPHADNSPG